MDRISIEHFSVFGLPPVAFVNLAADLYCQYISIALRPIAASNPHGYLPFSLTDDRTLRRNMLAAMRDRGVSIALGSGFVLREDSDVRGYAADLDALRELGVTRINTVSHDHQMARGFDNFGALVEMAAAAGMETMVELIPGLLIGDLPTALAAFRHVGRREFRLLVDTMHLVRSGAGAADIAAFDPDLIGYIQVCDAPLIPKYANYFDEARFGRMVPGMGELPLVDILAALPRHLTVGIEVPLQSEADAGVEPYDRLSPCVEATRQLLARIDDQTH